MNAIDKILTQAINNLSEHVPLIDFAVIWLAKLIVPIMVGLMIWNWWSKHSRERARYVSTASGLSFGLALAINQVISHIAMRPRPYDAGISELIVSPTPDFSFPSDHSAAAFSIAFALVILRHSWGQFFMFLAVFLSFSRVFIGIHYFSDVMGGMLSGFVAALIVVNIYRPQSALNQRLINFF